VELLERRKAWGSALKVHSFHDSPRAARKKNNAMSWKAEWGEKGKKKLDRVGRVKKKTVRAVVDKVK